MRSCKKRRETADEYRSGGARTWTDGGILFLMNKKLKLIKILKNN
jgi:hypothetical protein